MATPSNLNDCVNIDQLFGYVQNLSAKDIGLLGGRKFSTLGGKEVSLIDIVKSFEAIYGNMDTNDKMNVAKAVNIIARIQQLDKDATVKLNASGRVKQILTAIKSRFSNTKVRLATLNQTIQTKFEGHRKIEMDKLMDQFKLLPMAQIVTNYQGHPSEDVRTVALDEMKRRIEECGNHFYSLDDLCNQVRSDPQKYLIVISLISDMTTNSFREAHDLLMMFDWPQGRDYQDEGVSKVEEVAKLLASKMVNSRMFYLLEPAHVDLMGEKGGGFDVQRLDFDPRAIFSEVKAVESEPLSDVIGKAMALAVKQKCEWYAEEQRKRGVQNPIGIQVRLMQTTNCQFTNNEIYPFMKALADVSPIPLLAHVDLQDISGSLETEHVRELVRIHTSNPTLKQIDASNKFHMHR